MDSSLLKKTFCLALLLFSLSNFGQQFTLSEKAKASIITCDTGNESYSLFGHTAIRISDSINNLDVVYNYGAFDFSTPNFVAKFTKGDLQYFAVANSFSNFINQYTYENRSVFEQELIIPLAYKQKLFDNLNTSLASSESHYTYKFIDKNCTSMVVDMLNKTLDSEIIIKKTDTDKTYRSILYPYFDHFFYDKLGTSVIFGKKVDEYGTRLFLPFELHKSLQQIQLENHPICKESKAILEFKKENPSSWWNNIYTYLLFLGLILVLNRKSIHNLYFFVLGLLGIFFVFVGFYSFHQELANNYNVLLFNPTLLILLYFILTKNKKWIINLSIFNILSLVIYLVILFNKAHFLIVLPLLLTSMVLLTKMIFDNSKRIPIIV